MKRTILGLLMTLLASVGFAQPFVWPNAWSANPEDARSGGVLRQATVGEVRTFNPFVSAESTAVADLVFIGASLVRQGPDSDEFIPYAAESFTVSEDGLTIDVVLREGLAWSDGTPITVNDYFFTYQAETDEAVGSNSFDSWFIDGEPITLEITGDNSLRFNFPKPDRTALNVVAFVPWPDHVLGEVYREGGAEALRGVWGTDADLSQFVGSGPFIPVSYAANERVILQRNPHYGDWNVDEAGNPLPYLDEINFSVVESADSALNLYLAGQLDVFAPRNLDDIGVINVAVNNGDIDATVIENISPVASSQFIVWNWNLASNPFKQELFRSTDFRRAMSHLTDRETMVELVYGGAATPAFSSVYAVQTFWINDDIPKFEYDPEAALELLAGLGFTQRNSAGFLVDAEGNELGFTLVTNAGNNQREQLIQIFADSARAVGVNVQTQTLDFNLMVDQLLSTGDDRPFEAILIGLTGGSRLYPFGSNVVPCAGNLHMFNTSGECLTPQERLMERLYFEGRQTLDTEAARDIGFELQRVEAELQPIVYTVSPSAHASWLNTVGGEHPRELMSALVGTRQIQLTYKR
jgi:peptide/nickel transport system substrate-binding protein